MECGQTRRSSTHGPYFKFRLQVWPSRVDRAFGKRGLRQLHDAPLWIIDDEWHVGVIDSERPKKET